MLHHVGERDCRHPERDSVGFVYGIEQCNSVEELTLLGVSTVRDMTLGSFAEFHLDARQFSLIHAEEIDLQIGVLVCGRKVTLAAGSVECRGDSCHSLGSRKGLSDCWELAQDFAIRIPEEHQRHGEPALTQCADIPSSGASSDTARNRAVVRAGNGAHSAHVVLVRLDRCSVDLCEERLELLVGGSVWVFFQEGVGVLDGFRDCLAEFSEGVRLFPGKEERHVYRVVHLSSMVGRRILAKKRGPVKMPKAPARVCAGASLLG